MSLDKTYKNWKAVTEADFVSLFIKTWFAYISTLRIMFPEAYNRRGDGKYLNAYDPLDEVWQVIFKNAYLVLKEIVDLKIAELQKD